MAKAKAAEALILDLSLSRSVSLRPSLRLIVLAVTLSSAVANLLNKSENEDVSVSSVYVKECYADGAPHLKRFRAASMGRISRINKKSSHLTIVVSTDKK